ncbi:hypothetical protein SNOG_07961 [Parastagonospora nodorum SN15]|uniref:Uncharacterized protein n=1 Tax=Phaeosphaeria nodorum (strain SN15 / ATCC MYA-4574 / FGSC 10173) TaxID=321614 RepID=Q0UJV3_PHANO|nr:hypothetical protein SNOG_07961 [Parastagonospora nodorum SN15]EAT84237.1 hypothetical protein SNOG_07961 [Parastagonospora nodorum SN15]
MAKCSKHHGSDVASLREQIRSVAVHRNLWVDRWRGY